jgi:hypothetical protein
MKANNKLSRRLEIYSTFTGINLDIIITALRYETKIHKQNIIIGCECGCGGNQLTTSEKYLLNLAWYIRRDCYRKY